MNNNFIEQMKVCRHWERRCDIWFMVWHFVGGMAVMSLLVGCAVLSITLYVSWGIATFVVHRLVAKYGREVDKLGKEVGK